MTNPERSWFRLLIRLLTVVVIFAMVVGVVLWYKLFRETPQQLADDSPAEYFKYGSIGTEEAEGIPYYVWLVLPRMFPEYLPEGHDNAQRPGGYAAFGVAWEQGRETPVGFSKRTIGFPRVGINCALCHSTTYRADAESQPVIVPTGPSQKFDALSYLRFLGDCAADPRFTPENIINEMKYHTELSRLDWILYRYVIIPRTKEELLAQRDRLAWTNDRPIWGPGRIDPFNPVKFHQLALKDDKTIGNSDMMPIWNMAARKGQKLHWDGLNSDLTEVVNSGALGDGATNKSLPVEKLAIIQQYIEQQPAPEFPQIESVDVDLAAEGETIYRRLCFVCHGGDRTGAIIDHDELGTDQHRADMWTDAAVEAYSRYSDGYPWDFQSFENEPEGYVAVPLDGIWLRAPYLHNGSVPTLHDVLKPSAERPKQFYRGYDVYDFQQMGFVHALTNENAAREGFLFDVSQPGNSNHGHEGAKYGTTLDVSEKSALIEYLKTL